MRLLLCCCLISFGLGAGIANRLAARPEKTVATDHSHLNFGAVTAYWEFKDMCETLLNRANGKIKFNNIFFTLNTQNFKCLAVADE
jgi:hypothetical protein